MIRGVSRFAVEVCRTGSPYFERAICFVRPEYTGGDRLDLHRAARELVRGLDGAVEYSACAVLGDGTADAAEAAPENGGRTAAGNRGGAAAGKCSRRAAALLALLSALLGAAAAAAVCLYLSA